MEEQSGENRSLCLESLVCEACSRGPFAVDSFQQAITEDYGFSYTLIWEKIQNAADGGCNWCNLLVFANRTRPKTDNESKELQAKDLAEVRFRVEASNKSRNTLCFFINSVSLGTFDIYADPGDEAANYIGTGDIPRRKVPFVDYKVATEWIKKCADHEFCQKSKEVVLPTRVVDCSDPEKPKLRITNGSQGSYVALSYVWGEDQPLKTTTTNVDSYVRGINVRTLPQTIVDGIMSTHKLGVDYLWVDSLCILQDSPDDKLIEMSKMREIYEDAVVTIVARSAYAVTEGFLQDVQPAIRLPFQCPDGKSGIMLAQRRSIPSDRNMGEAKGGILTRAWCCQEAILPPRLLIFSSPFLTFRCRSIVANIARGLPVQTAEQSMETHLLFPNDPEFRPSDAQLTDLDDLWSSILGDYSERDMSRATDKFPAIAGVAEAFHLVWKREYIAGLWWETLIEDLLWRSFTTSSSALSPRPEKYRAPSWSWAATKGRILRKRAHFTVLPGIEYKCEILECKVTPKSELLPYGEVTEGFLKLKAKMKKVVWDPVGRYLIEPGSLWDGTAGSSADPGLTSPVQVYPDSTAEVTGGEVWLVLMQLGKTPYIWAKGLLIVPVDGKEDCFRRVGVLSCFCVPDWYETTEKQMITIL